MKKNNGKKPGATDVVTKLLKILSSICIELVADFTDIIIQDSRMPNNKHGSFISGKNAHPKNNIIRKLTKTARYFLEDLNVYGIIAIKILQRKF